MKTKSFEDTLEGYVLSTVKGAYRFKKYWMNKGYNENSSIERAINYAFGQINSAIGDSFSWEEAEFSFRELSNIANALANYCVQNKSNHIKD